jgi:DNA-binding NarL/FixJ family response regulator
VADAAANGRRSVRVLVADDNELFAETIAWMLDQHEEIEVVGRAVNGHAAVKLASVLQPDVVLMDLDMPVLDGIEATGALAGTDTRVVILTASAQDGDEERAAAAGAVEFLTKDMPIAEVATAVLAAAA